MEASEIQLVRNIPLFAKMTETEIAALAAMLSPKDFKPNSTLFWIGDKGTDFYIIQSGQVDLFYMDDDGREQHLASLKHGQFFGELSLLDGGPRTATARTPVETTLLCLGRGDFERYMLMHAGAAFHVLVVLGQRQREMLEKLRGIKNVNQVVAEKQSHWNHVAEFVASMMASPVFITLQIALLVVWIVINHLTGANAFDAYPFSLLSLVVSTEGLFLSAFVLVSQNRQSQRDRVRADLDYQVNLKAHMEVLQLQAKVDRIEKSLKSITVESEAEKAEKQAV